MAVLILALLWVAIALHSLPSWGERAILPLAAIGLLLTGGVAAAARRNHRRLQGIAETDPLTGLANHRGFHDALEGELGRAKRAQEQLAVVIADLDNFKAINDSRGHSHGDEVLIEVARAISACVREGDVAARIGGEEFALVLPGADAELAERIAERARAAVARVPAGGALSCSAGFAVYPEHADDAAGLCRLADGAMYSAKRGGKDRVTRFDPERVRVEWNDTQGAEIRAALDRPGAIVAVYQPVVSLASGTLVGYEALARFPDLPDSPVAGFFAQAHGCGLGAELEAAAIAAGLAADGRPPDAHLALNVSPSVLTSGLVQSALPADLTGLVIEVTEHELFPEEEALSPALRELRERGAQVAIDDTGAGYAGLRQLMRIKPDIVKLDTELTRAISTDPPRMALVDSFVRFARRVGAVVCAEGIESPEDLAVLADLDVEWGQGFAVGEPAEPWPEISPVAASACREALASALKPEIAPDRATITAGDRGLERLSARLAGTRSRAGLRDALALIAGELGADEICLSAYHRGSGRIETLAQLDTLSEETEFELDTFPLTSKALNEQRSVQVLAGDPTAEPREVELLLAYGYRSLLMVPVIHRGESAGLIEAFRKSERPWTRLEISRARIISNQFASTIETLFLGDAVLDRTLFRRG